MTTYHKKPLLKKSLTFVINPKVSKMKNGLVKMDRENIGTRIKKLRKEQKFSQDFVAKDLSITQAAYSRIENSNNRIVVEHIVKLSDLYKVTTDYILKGNRDLIEVSIENGFAPYISVKAHAGFVKNVHKKVRFEDQDWFRIPGFNPALDQKLFEVEGESMVPTIFPRDVLICQVQSNISKIITGSLVLIVTSSRVLAKRFLALEGSVMVLTNDNSSESKEERIDVSEIQQTLIICGKITGVLVPHHQVISEGKMESLEESVEMLKKEMFLLNKKIRGVNKQ